MEESTSCIFCYSRVSPPNQVVEEEEENGWRSVGKLKQFIEQFDLSFRPEVVANLCSSICEGCFSSLGKIVEFKKQADKVEGRVRALQNQVLDKMNELHNCLEKFHDELKYMVRMQMGGNGGDDDGGDIGVKGESGNLEGIVVQSKKQVCSEDAVVLRNKVVEVVRNRNFPQFIRRARPSPPLTPPTSVPATVKLVNTKMSPIASIIPISIPVIPGLAKLNRKRKGDEISKATKKTEDGGDVDDDILILEEAPPKSAKKMEEPESPEKRIPSPTTSDSTVKSSSNSDAEDSDDSADSLFTPIVKPQVSDPKLEKMMPAVALERLSPSSQPQPRPQPPPQPSSINKLEMKKTEESKPTSGSAPANNKKIVYFGDSDSSTSSSSSEEEDEAPLITFSPKFKISKWRQRIILGLFGKEKFELGEKRRRNKDFKEKWSLEYNRLTDKLSYGGIRILFWEEDKCIGCGGRKGRKACDFRTSHVESLFFEGIRGHIERFHFGEGGGDEVDVGNEEDDWEEDVTWAREEDEEDDDVVEVDLEGKRRSERVVKPRERLICGGDDKVEEMEEICKVCGQGFANQRKLKMHVWDHHGNVDRLGGGDGGEGGDEGKRRSLSPEEKFEMAREKNKISSVSGGEEEDGSEDELWEV